MQSRVEKLFHEDGRFQRYQVITGFEWNDLHYFSPGITRSSIEELVRLYDVNIIPKLSGHTGPYVFLHVPENADLGLERNTEEGVIYDDSVLLSVILRKAFDEGRISWNGRKLVTCIEKLERMLSSLEELGMLGIASDSGDGINFMPVDGKIGNISSLGGVSAAVNSHFFLMDPSDLDSPYCSVGSPYGLVLENGHVSNPPLNHRAMLLSDRRGKAEIAHVELEDLSFRIDGRTYRDGEGCTLHCRPEERVTPHHDGTDLVIIGDRVVALKMGGGTAIPCAGFVLSVPGRLDLKDRSVIYMGLEDYVFGTQVGPVMMEKGRMIDHLDFPFFREGLDPVTYPPTVYPLPFDKARASRICLGADRDGKPVLIWAEGEGKLGLDRKNDSTGATLLEMALFCRSLGLSDAVNLDGGGSAQLIYEGGRYLKMADRMPLTDAVLERPVPLGLSIL